MQTDEPQKIDINLSKIKNEVERASTHYYHSEQQLGIDYKTKSFIIERCIPHVKGPDILNLGYVDGSWTDIFLDKNFNVDIVEGASRHIKHAEERYSNNNNVRIYNKLFQEFCPDKKYNTIIAGDMIRYLHNPVQFLSIAKDWLYDDGCLIATIPNSKSLHRRIGALMQMESTPTAANKRDQEVGNIRSYDRYEFRNLFVEAGYNVNELRGCFLKPLSSEQISNWSDKLLRAFLDIGDELQDYCWFIYVICSKNNA